SPPNAGAFAIRAHHLRNNRLRHTAAKSFRGDGEGSTVPASFGNDNRVATMRSPTRMPDEQLLFAVETRLGFVVDVTVDRWQIITSIKHPAMQGSENAVKTTLAEPEQIRRSRSDA